MSRTRYRYNPETKALEEVAGDYTGGHDETHAPFTDSYMDGVRTADGVDIGSRRKRRDYMRAAGVADASDYTGEWAKAARRREDVAAGRHDKARRIEAIQRAFHNSTRRK